jgi:hypothetical protein
MEFCKPDRGAYEIVRVLFTAEAVRELDLMPPESADFVAGTST